MHLAETICHGAYAVLWSGKSCRPCPAGIADMAGLRTAVGLSYHTLPLSINSEHLLLASGWGSYSVLGLSFCLIMQNANMLFFLGTKQVIFFLPMDLLKNEEHPKV